MTPDQKEAFRREVLEEAANAVHEASQKREPWRKDGLMSTTETCAVIRALSASRPAPAADTGQAVAMTVIDPEQWESCSPEWLHRNPRGCAHAPRVWNEAERNHYHPRQCHSAPLDAERVREDERDRLYSIAALSDHPGEVAWNAGLFLRSIGGAMLPADRAALRQKEGGQ